MEAVTTKLSPRSVADTVSRLQELIAAKGMKLFTVIDQSGEAERVGLELRDTKLVVFGSPQAGTPIIWLSSTIVAIWIILRTDRFRPLKRPPGRKSASELPWNI